MRQQRAAPRHPAPHREARCDRADYQALARPQAHPAAQDPPRLADHHRCQRRDPRTQAHPGPRRSRPGRTPADALTTPGRPLLQRPDPGRRDRDRPDLDLRGALRRGQGDRRPRGVLREPRRRRRRLSFPIIPNGPVTSPVTPRHPRAALPPWSPASPRLAITARSDWPRALSRRSCGITRRNPGVIPHDDPITLITARSGARVPPGHAPRCGLGREQRD